MDRTVCCEILGLGAHEVLILRKLIKTRKIDAKMACLGKTAKGERAEVVTTTRVVLDDLLTEFRRQIRRQVKIKMVES